jgi:hypothetical protein
VKYKTFLSRFHPQIIAGTKTTTIRGNARISDGEDFAARFWMGKPYRSPMGTLGICHRATVLLIELAESGITLDGFVLPRHLLYSVARKDGFREWEEMRAHFRPRLPFTGFIIAWKYFTPAPSAPGTGREG